MAPKIDLTVTFSAQYTFKYTGFGFQAPPVPIYRYDEERGYPSAELGDSISPSYEMSRKFDKLDLTSAEMKSSTHTILTYLKNQKIEISDMPESADGIKATETIPLEWYTKYSQPKIFDMRFSDGTVYRWWSMGEGVFELVQKSKTTKDETVMARIANAGEKDRAVLIVSIAHAAEYSHLTEQIIISSAFGVIKKCEKNLVHFGWFDAGATAKSNGIANFFTGLGSLGS